MNIIRPVYTYDSITTSFTPAITLSNIDAYSGNTLSIVTAAIGDASGNMYVGSNAGNPFSILRGCSGVTALGSSAGATISNVSSSVFVGSNAGVGASNASGTVSVGAGASGIGSSNVRIGASTGGVGAQCVVVGAASTSSTFSNAILLGSGITATQSNQLRIGSSFLYGDTGINWFGMGVATPTHVNTRLDVSGNVRLQGQVGVQMNPTRALDVNGSFRANDGLGGSMDVSGGLTTSSHGFTSIQGSVLATGGGASTGALLRRGIVMVSAVNITDATKHAARILFATTTSSAVDIGSNVSATASITLSTSNIQITDPGEGTYVWSVTYVPLP